MLIIVASEDEKWISSMMTSWIGRPAHYDIVGSNQPPTHLDRFWADQQNVIHRWEEKVGERWNMSARWLIRWHLTGRCNRWKETIWEVAGDEICKSFKGAGRGFYENWQSGPIQLGPRAWLSGAQLFSFWRWYEVNHEVNMVWQWKRMHWRWVQQEGFGPFKGSHALSPAPPPILSLFTKRLLPLLIIIILLHPLFLGGTNCAVLPKLFWQFINPCTITNSTVTTQ